MVQLPRPVCPLIFLILALGSCQSWPGLPESQIPPALIQALEALTSGKPDPQTQGPGAWPRLEAGQLWFAVEQPGASPPPQVLISGRASLPLTGKFQGSEIYFGSIPWISSLAGQTYEIRKTQGQKTWEGPDPLNPFVRYQGPLSSQIVPKDFSGETFIRIPRWQPRPNPLGLAPRDVFVWLPPGYFTNPETTYPTVYFNDGQQVWDSDLSAWKGWKAETAAKALMAQGKIPPVILVGVANSSQRGQEFLGWQNTKKSPTGSLAEGYADFIAREVKPWVDKYFRTRPGRESTGIVGSSNGSTVSLYIASRYPWAFSLIGGLSGAGASTGNLMNLDHTPDQFRIYLDCGGRDLDARLVPGVKEYYQALVEKGFTPGKTVVYRDFPEALHNEAAWAERMPFMLEWFFGPENYRAPEAPKTLSSKTP